jgi:hypothetical protein
MKKLLFLIQLTAAVILFSPLSYADSDSGHRGHGWGHHHHYDDDDYYVQPQVNYYYQQPEVRYYQAPPVRYYQQPQYADPRSHQGLAGGVIGSVFGYEMGSGDPLATGLGAAAGSYLGNGMGGRW